jgi:RecA-family ATPase
MSDPEDPLAGLGPVQDAELNRAKISKIMANRVEVHQHPDAIAQAQRLGLQLPPDAPPPNPFLEDASPRASRFFLASEWAGKSVPPLEWLVCDLVPSGTVTLLGGDGGTGKSLLALQLAYAVATGGAWLGRAVAGGGVMIISAEDDAAELHRRTVKLVQADGGSLEDLHRMTLRSLAGEDALLANMDRSGGALVASALFREIEARIAEESPVLVVFDTLADMFPGNENDRAQARQFIGLLRGLAIKHECAVLLLSHPSLTGLNGGGGTSGSTAWNNSVRSRLYLERVMQDGYEADPDARLLSCKKANYGRSGGEISLTWQGGVFVADTPESGVDRMAVGAKAERVFLKLLAAFTAQGRRVNGNGGPTYAPKMFAESAEAEGVTKRAFRAAMDSLYAKGAIRNETTGPASRPVTYICIGGV